ncbi:alanine dehydrogenase [Anaerovorax odorimutans]|uniref:alanine dehydrogenase n=1 Tax=Anaerovorax odorimutans TaxID=109327 RepID=A0ABT1RLI2_9FIRM|nr:alanine dehydrogenase [Anaerovorax odorimutans]MCQ4636046.1 alanine dehydrogenase [Anaerovorax odorimutans]
MIFGLLKDIKNGEYRTIATPTEILTIVGAGHTALVQSGAGEKAGFEDEAYAAAGARIVSSAEEIFGQCDLVTKVKEIEPPEYDLLREGQIILTCIHPAAHPEEVQVLLDKKVIAFTAEDSHRYGSPNCEAAGKQGALAGLNAMLTVNGGKGKFVSGLAGAPGMNVVILGAGIVGKAALSVLHALGAKVTVMDISLGVLREVEAQYHNSVDTMYCTKENIRKLLPNTDMILNCVKWPKGNPEFLVDREMLKLMEKGSVLVDISNDPGGAIESFHETTHEDPTYVENGVVHYCVSNIPGAIAGSTTVAYAAAMLPHFMKLLNDGVEEACVKDGFLRRSLTVYKGYLTHEETSALQGRPWIRPEDILGIADRDLDPAPPATVTRSDNFIVL